MGPAQLDRLLCRLAGHQTEEESGREPVPASYSIENVQLAFRRDIRLPVDPGHRAPAVPVGRVYLPERCGDNLDLWMAVHDAIDHATKGARIELGLAGDI